MRVRLRLARAVALWGLCGALAGTAWAQAKTSGTPASAAASATVRALRAAGIARVSESQGTVRATVVGDSLWEIAGATTAGSNVTRNQAMVAILRRNPQAFPEGNLHRIQRGLSLEIPSLAEMRQEPPAQAAALIAQHRQAYGNRTLAPMPLYALAAGAAMPAAAPLPRPAASAASAVSAGPDARDLGAAQGAASTPASMPWWPLGVLLALGAVAVGLLIRRQGHDPRQQERAAAQAHATRAFADSRLDLESQLEVQPEVDSEPLYSTLDEPVDAWPAAPTQAPSAPPAPALVLKHGALSAQAAASVPGQPPSGAALALALSVAHAYADVGRPEAARRWLRAIDARGDRAFQPGP